MNKILFFNIALAPYRIDFYNYWADSVPSSFYFTQKDVEDSYFDMNDLINHCHFTPRYVNGIKIKRRFVPRNLLSIIKRENPTHIFVSEFSPIAFLVCLYKLIFRYKYKVISICDDSLDMLEGNEFSVSHKTARRFILPMLDEIILLDSRSCDWYKKYFEKGLWFPLIRKEESFRKRLKKLLPMSIKTIKEYGLENKYIILFVGRLIKLKNIPTLLQAIEKLHSKKIKLIIIGDGVEKKSLKQQASELHINVHFLGWKNNDELLLWYNIAHLFVLPSMREPFGAVVNEALMAGCRVCVSSRAGSASLISETNGNLFDPTQIDQLVYTLKKEFHNFNVYHSAHIYVRPSLMKDNFTDLMKSLFSKLNI